MKMLLTFLIFLSYGIAVKAQQAHEVSVALINQKTVKGVIKVLNSEGVGVEDSKGSFFAIKAHTIKSIVVKKKILTVSNFGGYYYFRFYPGFKAIGYSKEKISVDWKKLENMASITNTETLLLSQELGITAKNKSYKQRLQIKGNADYFRDNFYTIQSFLDEKIVYNVKTESLDALN